MNILIYFSYFLLDLINHGVSAFNIDTEFPIIYLDQTNYLKLPANKSSYFGLSVILNPGDNINLPWIQIGAPRGNSPNLRQYSTPGAVFRCDIPNSSGKTATCLPLEVETRPIIRRDIKDKIHNAWIGAVMDIDREINRTVICAPRWTRHITFGNYDDRMLGACYWSDLQTTKYQRMIPLADPNQHIYKDPATRVSVYNWGQGCAGFSAHMPRNKNELILGAPGVFDWTGTSLRYKDSPPPDIPSANKYAVSKEFSSVNIPDVVKWEDTTSYGLLGYAVTSGYFYSNKTLHYVSGAPRSSDYMGQIIVYNYQEDTNKTLRVRESRTGTQFGEYFGASLAAGDIDGDGTDDLFVGAPFYTKSKYNEGRMYVFFGNKQVKRLEEPYVGKVLDGKHPDGQFGTAITYLGNMNRDGFRYVAVSAPYEENSGVVYIFRGEKTVSGVKTGLKIEPIQRIVGSHFLPEIRGFGISISKPADVDGNGYRDIAIGAYKSGHVVLLRSKPLIVIRTWFKYIPASISNTAEEFVVALCHNFTSYRGMESIDISRKLVVDEVLGRAYLEKSSDSVRNIRLYERSNTCEPNITIRMKRSGFSGYEALSISANTSLIERKKVQKNLIISDKQQGDDEFCMRCGVHDENKLELAQAIRKVPYVLECGGHKGCFSELEFECHFNGTGVRNNTFIIGASNVITLNTTVRNKGENAYDLQVLVELPQEISLKQIPQICEQTENMFLCDVVDPLETNHEESMSLNLDMGLVNQKVLNKKLQIRVTVLTGSENKNEASKMVELNLATEVDIYISGKSSEQSYSYGNKSSSEINFQQTYQIGKLGLSPVTLISFQIFIPYAITTSSGNITFLSIHAPEGTLEGGQDIQFNSSLKYLENRKIQSSEGIVDVKVQETRRKRFAEYTVNTLPVGNSTEKYSKLQEENLELLGDKVFDINCNRTDIICGRISGSIGPFKGLTKSAVVGLRMVFNKKAVSGLISENPVIRYSTYGSVEIEAPFNLAQSGARPDKVVVNSIFVNDEKKIGIWIIIISVIVGFLLLLVLTLGLIKAGFFKRAKKEELKQLKSQTQMNDTENSMEEVNMDKQE